MHIKLAVFIFFMFSCTAYADDTTTIGHWAQHVLVETLSASYKDTPAEIAAVRKNYLPGAWGPMHQFLLDKRVEINKKKLTLHPKPLHPPVVIASNDCGLSPCWKVSQSFNIPEMSLTLDFSLQIVPASLVKKATSLF
ncbi:hypothetical protein Loa_01352 [Legionella oakridgensis ATCC 33761 = DSM 21215]|uniref:Uncharacterized protein n=2 Tax=Legionella oakridgensis TaxID=29423 RepID=W0BAN8_9GAMM|nr:hypothetical protein [Legionella oakridgensis]AHE66905.1 hypothetical protein Loa_01352 [Legionella oakridgensis ATCC 33761 = DSM 21215]